MPSITLTLTDTPHGGVAVHSDFKPAVGHPISPAQGYALEIINRTHRQWGIPASARDGIDIDAVHRIRDGRVVQPTDTQ